MKKTTIIFLAAFTFLFTGARSQDQAILTDALPAGPSTPGVGMGGQSDYLHQTLFSFNYGLSWPMADLKEFVSTMGYRGWNVELRVFALQKLAIGGEVGWNAFYEKRDRATYEFENGALTSTIFTYFYTVPLRAKLEYFISPSSYIQPFIGLYVGTNYNERTTEVGFYSFEDKSWNFSLAPEVGLIIPFASNAPWGFNIKARYNYQVYSRDNFQGLHYVDLMFGFTYSY